MAARRLLIVMLILLGLSTLAAALVPQRTLREGTTNTTTTSTQATTTAPATPSSVVPPIVKLTVTPNQLPLLRAQAGTQFTLLIRSKPASQISIPEFGQLGFATPKTPARFQLLPNTPGTFGILFAASGRPAAQLQVLSHLPQKGEKKKGKRKGKGAKGSKSRVRAGSGPA